MPVDFLPENIAKALVSLWDSSPSPPDIFAFLTQNGCVRPETLVPVLAVDQKYRWRTDTPLRVEDYLAQLPHLTNDQEFKLQLAVHEFEARRVRETFPSIDEYTERFSDISNSLRSALAKKIVKAGELPQDSLATSATIVYANNLEFGQLGRYRLTRILGEGAFGRVYLAYDEELARQVAIKVPTPQRFEKPEDVLQYLAEARTVANLDHPNIVPVYDMGRTEEGSVYVVSKYIEGCTLENQIKRDRPDHETTSKWLSTIALALHHAHSRRLIHRDVKPGNILLEGDGPVPYLADFGLAIREEEFLRETKIAGTPAYMSPEQARGEGHRLDGRSDIFSLGVILYEMLTGHRPFRGSTPLELIIQVTTAEPRPLRAHDPAISPELERICMKALAKRASDRYESAVELADDLLHWNQTPVQEKREMTIVPKGLRSFDAEDADFFLDLLPGPRTRSGLPENLQFWKTRIEEPDPEKTFSVGLIYGPSGCGKSSLMKAGLLPRLSRGVVSVYLEATPDETEIRILRGLRKALPELTPELGLVESFVWLRQREKSASKVVVILDQFEQWLHAHGAEKETDLVKALRHCDGKYLHAIVMVRDDFAMAAARFMDALDVPIVQGKNFATVDLFDIDHAERVLVKFGQAFGKLPQDHEKMSESEITFVQRVASGLVVEGKVVSVQIALFAEMVKGKPWTLQTLEDVGGTEGVGVNFLEETFGSRMANPEHRLHQQAARQILAALLPEVGTEIKGHMQSHDALLDAAGYADRPAEFTDLLRILDGELRLITPMDPAGDSLNDSGPSSSLATRYYQLTHDFLVPSLRQWLTRKQRETKRGRAELKLAERAAAWKNLEENKQLPTFLEWLQIRRWTDKRRWTLPEQSLMRIASRVHLRNWGSSTLIVALLAATIGYLFQQQRLRGQQEKIAVALDSLQKTLGPAVPVIIDKLVEMQRPEMIREQLVIRYAVANETKEKLSLAFALARFGPVEADYLVAQIDSIEDRDTANLLAALGYDASRSIEVLRRIAGECTTSEFHRRKARLTLAALGIGDTTIPIDVLEFEGRPDPGVRTWFIAELPKWELDLGDLVSTVEDSQSPALRSAVCLGLGQIPKHKISTEDVERIAQLATRWHSLPDSSTHSAVVWMLRQWELPEPALADAREAVDGRDWFVNSQGATFVRITPPPVETKPIPDPLENARQQLAEMDKAPPEEKTTPGFRLARGQHLFNTGKSELALAEFDAILGMDLEDSMKMRLGSIEQLRLLALARLQRAEEAEGALAMWIASEPSTAYRDYVESVVPLWLGRKEDAVLRLEKGLSDVGVVEREVIYNRACAVALFAADASATAAERKSRIDRSIALLESWSNDSEKDRDQARTDPDLLALHSDPRFGELAAERPNIPVAPYWIANREVTRGEFEAFLQESSYAGEKSDNISPTSNHPAQNVSWYDAVMYCNWLSLLEGRTLAYRNVGRKKIEDRNDRAIEVDQWALDESADGYQLPKELEWEYACRAGSESEWSMGNDDSLLEPYCVMFPSKLAAPCGTKLPNAWGLHDMHGNVWEWCWDIYDMSWRRVGRGGCWDRGAPDCRSVYRSRLDPSSRYNYLGFRLLLSSDGRSKPAESEPAD